MRTLDEDTAPVRPLDGAVSGGRSAIRCVREVPLRYEDEGSLRVAGGAVTVGRDAWWSAELAVPWSDVIAGPARLRLQRHGPPGPGADAADVMVPVAELAALVVLVAGVVAQARRDGVCGGAPARDPSR